MFGVSLDREEKHRGFRSVENLPFDLLADPEGKLCRMYGVKVRNLLVVKLSERVTYVIGRDGRIREAFASVRPAGHAADVLSCL